jgi:enterochelin esterase-like enzyme
LLEDTIETALLDRPVEILVYLPPCYAQLTELSYPALYLIHGQGFDRYQWPQLGLIDLVDKWTINGEVPPFLIVMPEVGDWGEPDVFPFGQALVEEIIPRIEGDYRALPKRGFRKVGGISRGAGWALHLGLNYWETFSALGAHSLPVFYSDAPMIPYWLESIPPNQHPGIYLDYAESDMSPIRRSINKLIEQLEARGFEYQFFTAPGIHNQEYWRGNIEEYLRFYLTGW